VRDARTVKELRDSWADARQEIDKVAVTIGRDLIPPMIEGVQLATQGLALLGQWGKRIYGGGKTDNSIFKNALNDANDFLKVNDKIAKFSGEKAKNAVQDRILNDLGNIGRVVTLGAAKGDEQGAQRNATLRDYAAQLEKLASVDYPAAKKALDNLAKSPNVDQKWIKDLRKNIDEAGSSFEAAVDPIVALRDAVNSIRPKNLQELGEALLSTTDLEGQAKAATDLVKALDAAGKARAGLAGQQRNVDAAQTGVTDADANTAALRAEIKRRKETDPIKNQISDIQAARGLRDAKLAIVDADSAVVKSTEAVDDARKTAARSGIAIRQAEVALADAMVTAERGPRKVEKATRALEDARIAASRVGEQIARQESATSDAKRRETRAFEDQAVAVRDATRALNGYGSSSREARDAADSLRETQRSAIETQLDLADSADRIQEEQKRLATTTDSAERARIQRSIQRAQLQQQRIQDASLRVPEKVADAQRNLSATRDGVKILTDEKSVDAARSANRTIEDSQTTVRDAVRGTFDAEQALTAPVTWTRRTTSKMLRKRSPILARRLPRMLTR
jgi:hypothetical protein